MAPSVCPPLLDCLPPNCLLSRARRLQDRLGTETPSTVPQEGLDQSAVALIPFGSHLQASLSCLVSRPTDSLPYPPHYYVRATSTGCSLAPSAPCESRPRWRMFFQSDCPPFCHCASVCPATASADRLPRIYRLYPRAMSCPGPVSIDPNLLRIVWSDLGSQCMGPCSRK